ncbi:MAG: adenosine deaminase [Anaerolineales bacterium]|nr:adenosine deaminase [Anaerolineales bacterium]
MINPSIPLIDLHRHLDGSVRLETILELGRKHNLPLPADTAAGLKPHIQIMDPQPGVMAFISKFYWMTEVMVDYDACRRIAYENVEDVRAEGLDYAELRFSPWFMAEKHQLNPAGVVEAVVDGVEAASRALDIPVGLIGILSRTYGPETAWEELDALITASDHLCGIDLAGDEAHFPATMFESHFDRAREQGWGITVHAGESAGPESIWDALRTLGADRIGHAVSAVQDPALMDYMRDHQIGIEANLTSNIQTSTVKAYASHPLRTFLEHGILATINTDDPGISDITLAYEYEVAAPAACLSLKQIYQAQRNSLTIAFLPDQRKNEILQQQTT